MLKILQIMIESYRTFHFIVLKKNAELKFKLMTIGLHYFKMYAEILASRKYYDVVYSTWLV